VVVRGAFGPQSSNYAGSLSSPAARKKYISNGQIRKLPPPLAPVYPFIRFPIRSPIRSYVRMILLAHIPNKLPSSDYNLRSMTVCSNHTPIAKERISRKHPQG
jgi:hypothetical protein